jgi:XTP/dITP diphosphohydrolase
MKLHFVTSNKGKAGEAQMILGLPIEITSLDLPEIQSLDLEEIVREKVIHAYEKIKEPVFVDDVGLFVNAWNGFPGPFIKFLIEAGGNELLLKMMSSVSDRKMTAKASIGFHDGSKIHTFIGEIKGTLVEESRGDGGWGWDPLFIPENSDKTYAEMSPEEKNAFSHRRNALEKFRKFLDEKEILDQPE